MKGIRLLAAVCWLCTSLPTAASPTTWERYPGLANAGQHGIVIGDFDGDGRSEAVVAGYTSATHLLAVLGADSLGELGIRSITSAPRTILSQPIVVPQSDGSHRLALITGDPNNSSTNQILILAGMPLRILRTIEAPLVQRISAIADVDADGQLDIVVLTSLDFALWEFFPAILDYASGAVKWIGSQEASDVGVAQLDDDPALELILAAVPGHVIDGATLEFEWTYSSGFGNNILVGRFGNDGRVGFATTTLFSDYVQVFRSRPYSPVSQIDIDVGEPRTASTVQIEQGPADQIAIGGRSGDVMVYSPLSGQRILAISTHLREVNAIAVGDIDGDGGSELVYSTGSAASGSALLRAIDLDTLEEDYLQTDGVGPYSSLVRGPFRGGNSDEIAFFSTSSNLDVLDSVGGSRLRGRADVFDNSLGEPASGIASAQLDTDEQQELIVTRSSRPGVVAVLDGLSLDDQWRIGGYGSVFQNSGISSVTTVDANGDGTLDVVVATSDSAASVVVLDGHDGSFLWQSIPMWGLYPPRLATFRANNGEPRIVVTRDAGLYMFDVVGETTIASIPTPGIVTGLWQWGEGAACRLGALNMGDVVTVHRCDTLAIEGQRPMPPGTVFFRPLDAQANRFIAASGHHLYEVTSDNNVIKISDPLGKQLGAHNLGEVRPGADAQHFDVVIGSDYMVTRVQVALDAILANGFD